MFKHFYAYCMSALHLNASMMVFKVIFIINTTHSTARMVGDTDHYGCVSLHVYCAYVLGVQRVKKHGEQNGWICRWNCIAGEKLTIINITSE